MGSARLALARRAVVLSTASGLMVSVLLYAPSASAQTIGGTVQQHADEHLQPKKKKKKRSSHPSSHRPARPAPVYGPPPQQPPPAKPSGPSFPIRVIGKNLQLDPQLGVAYRGWYAQQYPTVAVSSQAYATWSISTKLRLFRLLSVDRGYYESNALSAPRHSGASIAAQAGKFVPKTARVLGAIGIPMDWIIEPLILYETRAYETTATPNKPVRIIPRSASRNQQNTDFPLTQEPLTMVAGFESFVVAGKYNPEKGGMIGGPTGDFPPFYLGVGVLQYTKPYQFNVGDAVLDEFIFDARFRGAGLALGFATPEKADSFYADFSGMAGMGEVRLLDDLTLNEVVAADTYIGYAQANLIVGYLYPLLRTKPTLMLGANVSMGGATFFFFKTQYQQDEQIETPALNWDLLWGAQAYLVLPL